MIFLWQKLKKNGKCIEKIVKNAVLCGMASFIYAPIGCMETYCLTDTMGREE